MDRSLSPLRTEADSCAGLTGLSVRTLTLSQVHTDGAFVSPSGKWESHSICDSVMRIKWDITGKVLRTVLGTEQKLNKY